jgi:Ca-activated chloride channel family protein
MLTYPYIQRHLARDAALHGNLALWLLFRCLPTLVLGSLLLLLLSAAPARAMVDGAGDAMALDELEGGHLLLRDVGGGRYVPAVIHRSKVHFDISGMVARVVLEQRFSNDSDRWVEGVYAFPLPEKAAVRYLEMIVGERRIVGKVREKAEARKIYQRARQAGKKASLVEQQRPNLFTNRVANIGPGEEITVRLEYVQQVNYGSDMFSLRFPMTITPRYMPGAPLPQRPDTEEGELLFPNPYLGWAVPTDQVPDADAVSPLQHPSPGSDYAPLNPIEISVRFDPGMPLARVESPYHEIALSRRAGVYSLDLAAGVSEMDRDFVLNWQPVTGSEPAAALFTERVGDEHFGLLMLVPPVTERLAPPAPREIIFVVDTSGSMGGVSIEQARASLARALQQLRPEDHFNIIEFNSRHRSLYRRPMPATRHHLTRASEFVRQLHASGGTEMMPALRAAMAPSVDEDVYREQPALRQIIFITDGAVGNELALFEEISGSIGDNRLFTVGIGSAPNSWFMRNAARYGRGSHTHIGKLDEVGEKMSDLFEHLSRPVAVDLAVTWPGPVEVWPERVPDLYAGQPLVLAVKFGGAAPTGEVSVSADINGRSWRQAMRLSPESDPASPVSHPGVASLWAREKITGLLDQKVLGRDESELRAEVLEVALQHQLLSPYTSFVAVEEQVSRPQGKDVKSEPVLNTRPRGQAPQGFAYPATATTGPARAWFAALALFLAMMLCVLRRPELDHVPTAGA